MRATYKLRGKVWLYPSEDAAWHFVNVPKKQSRDIRETFAVLARGFGSLPVEAVVGKTRFKTSIFPDSKSGIYLLPLKAEVRKKEGIKTGHFISFTIEIKA